MAYTRRMELTFSEAELVHYGDKILLENEVLYVKLADGTRTVRFGDGVTPIRELPVSIDYNAVKAQAAAAAASAAAAETTRAQTETIKNETETIKQQAEAATDYYTPRESVRRLAYLLKAEGEVLNMDGTLAGPAAELELYGKTVVTPTDPEQAISPENAARIVSVGAGGIFKYLKCKGNALKATIKTKTDNGLTLSWDEESQIIEINGTQTTDGDCGAIPCLPGGYGTICIAPDTPFIIGVEVLGGTKTMASGSASSLRLLMSEYRADTGTFTYSNAALASGTEIGFFKNVYRRDYRASLNGANFYIWRGKAGDTYKNLKVRVFFSVGSSAVDAWDRADVGFGTIPLKDTAGNPVEPLRSPAAELTGPGKWNDVDQIVYVDEKWQLWRQIYKIPLSRMGPTAASTIRLVKDFEDASCVVFFYGFWGTTPSSYGFHNVMSNVLPTVAANNENLLNNMECVTGHNHSTWTIKISIKKDRLTEYGYAYNLTNAEKMQAFLAWCDAVGAEFYCPNESQSYTPLHPDTQAALNSLAEMLPGCTILMGTDAVAPYLKATVGLQPNKVIRTRDESDQRYSNALVKTASGEVLDLHTADGPARQLTLLGSTVVSKRQVTFTATTLKTSGASLKTTLPYLAVGSSITISGCTIAANNKTAEVTAVSSDGTTLTFAAGTFAAGSCQEATITCGSDTDVPISPDSPAVIESVGAGGVVQVSRTGKNLIDYENPKHQYAVSLSDRTWMASDGDDRAPLTFKAQIRDNKGVTLKTYSFGPLVAGKRASVSFVAVEGGQVLRLGNNGSRREWELTYPLNAPAGTQLTVSLYVVDATVGASKFRDIQVELGTTPTAYEPYKGGIITIPLKDAEGGPVELRSTAGNQNIDKHPDYETLPNFRDNIIKGKHIRNIGRIGPEDWAHCVLFIANLDYVPEGSTCFTTRNIKKINTVIVSNALPWSNGRNGLKSEHCIWVSGGDTKLFITLRNDLAGIVSDDEDSAKLAKARAYLEAIGEEILFVALTPTEVPLHPETCTALDDLSRMLPGRTVILGTDAVAPSFEAEYVEDANYRIHKLESAIVALGGSI